MNKYSVPEHINHHQSWRSKVPSIRNVDICTKLIQTINPIARLTGKGDVRFMSFNTGLFPECKMLKDFKIKLTGSQCSSQKSDKQPLPTRENRLIYPLILFFSAAGESQASSCRLPKHMKMQKFVLLSRKPAFFSQGRACRKSY